MPRDQTPYVTQRAPSAKELRVLSQPRDDANFDSYKYYVYPAGAGKQSFIYHAELGINPTHVDFRGRKGEWVFTGSPFVSAKI